MLLDLPDLVSKYDMKVAGILHIGAHLAEEADIYADMDVQVLWVDPLIENWSFIDDKLQSDPKYRGQGVLCALVTDKDDEEIDFHITNYAGMSSSIFEFGTHPTFSPDTVFVETRRLRTRTIDNIIEHFDPPFGALFNFLNMDIQGAELKALQGASQLIPQLDYIMCEVNKEEVYKGCAKVWEIDEFLTDFTRVETSWVGEQGWGDAFFCRSTLL